MNSATELVNTLTTYHMSQGKTEQEASVLVLSYLKAFLERLAMTDRNMDRQLQQRVESIKARMPKQC